MKFGAGRPPLRDQPRGRLLRRRARAPARRPTRTRWRRSRELDLHQLRAHRRRRRLVGGHDRRAAGAPDRLARRRLDARLGRARPRTRTRASRRRPAQCPSIAPEWEDPAGVPIDAMLFGGRRSTVVPLVPEAFDWEHGVFLGATMSLGDDRRRRRHRRRAAPRPVRDAAVLRLPHGRLLRPLARDRRASATRRSCRRSSASTGSARTRTGRFLWPGFGENSRVLAWVFRRCEGKAEAVETPIGLVPAPRARSTPTGLDVARRATMAELLQRRPRRAGRTELPADPRALRQLRRPPAASELRERLSWRRAPSSSRARRGAPLVASALRLTRPRAAVTPRPAR